MKLRIVVQEVRSPYPLSRKHPYAKKRKQYGAGIFVGKEERPRLILYTGTSFEVARQHGTLAAEVLRLVGHSLAVTQREDDYQVWKTSAK
jgi:hypothetical protein